MLATLRAASRATFLVAHLGSGLLQALYLGLRDGRNWHESATGQATIQRWMQRLTRILALRISVPERPLPVPAMIVANHISWLDIIALASVRPTRFLAKDTVRRWPLIGALAALSGTLFIRRGAASALRESNDRLCRSLRIRQQVAIFPEGTTSDGRAVGPFHSALFEAARRAYCPIQPLAIRYRNANGAIDTRAAPYVEKDIFVLHLWRILSRRETRVELHFLPPISSRESRRELARQSRALIVANLAADCRLDDATPRLRPLPHRLLARFTPRRLKVQRRVAKG